MATSPSHNSVSAAPVLGEHPSDLEIWQSLKQAISTSSGFQRWKQERNLGSPIQPSSLDEQVRGYLRQTLETLAY